MTDKYLITQSLLSSFDWRFYKDNFKNFVKTLKKEKIDTSFYMENGISFETLVNNYLNNGDISNDERMKFAIKIADIVKGSEIQVKKHKEIEIDGINFLLYGVADYVSTNCIFDCKYVKSYRVGKYKNSPQHKMYFELFENIDNFFSITY